MKHVTNGSNEITPPTSFPPQLYQPPTNAELTSILDLRSPERSTLRILGHLDKCGFIAPLWEEADMADEEINTVKARLQSLGYLD